MASQLGEAEATRRYRALVVTTLRQLHGLQHTRLQIRCEPGDAEEAIRFWLLPRLADKWHAHDDAYHSDGWEIGFGPRHDDYEIIARGEILCPWLGARWVHTAMLGLERGTHRAIGLSPDGLTYFEAQSTSAESSLSDHLLPPLSIIHTDDHWQEALDSALGASLKKAWEEET